MRAFGFVGALLSLVICWQLIDVAAIWDYQANPLKNAEVKLEGGVTYVGDLSKTWSGQHQLETKEGKTIIFDEFLLIKTTPLSNAQDQEGLFFVDFLRHWRLYLPMVAIQLILIACLFGLAKPRKETT